MRAFILRNAIAQNAHLLPLLTSREKAFHLLQEADLAFAIHQATDLPTVGDEAARRLRPRIQKLVEQFEVGREISDEDLQYVYNFIRKKIRVAERVEEKAELLDRYLKNMSIRHRMDLLENIPDEVFLELGEVFDRHVESLKFSRTPSLSVVLDEISNAKGSDMTKNDLAQFKDALLRYFDEIPLSTKRRIVGAWLELPPGASREAQLAAAFQNAGPALQKVFQLLGRHVKSPEAQRVMKELLSNVKPIPWVDAEKVLREELGRPIEEVFSSVDEKPLAAGTIGQVHRARLKGTNEEVVIKIRRPGLREAFEDEFSTFRRLVEGNPAAEQLVARMEENFLSELDFRDEMRNLTKAQVYRNLRRGIDVPHPIESIRQTEKLVVMSMASGAPLGKLEKLDPHMKADALYETLKAWFREAMFGSGFFHGDMHPGNLLFEGIPGGKPPWKITIIDAGSAGQLSFEQRRKFLEFFVGVADQNVDEAFRALTAFGNVPPGKEAQIKEIVRTLALDKSGSVFENASEILARSIQHGMELDPVIVMFNRANLFLYQELHNTNRQILKANPKARVKRPTRAYMIETLRELGWEMPKRTVHGEESLMDIGLLRKVFVQQMHLHWGKVKAKCSDLFHRVEKVDDQAPGA